MVARYSLFYTRHIAELHYSAPVLPLIVDRKITLLRVALITVLHKRIPNCDVSIHQTICTVAVRTAQRPKMSETGLSRDSMREEASFQGLAAITLPCFNLARGGGGEGVVWRGTKGALDGV
jgi:hypothetical protein